MKIGVLLSQTKELPETSRETRNKFCKRKHDPTNNLSSDCQTPELKDNNFPLLKPPPLWYFAMAALGN